MNYNCYLILNRIVSYTDIRFFYIGGIFSKEKNIKDNNRWNCYNSKGDDSEHYPKIRVPSLKRNKKIWENFYRLFPYFYTEMFLEKEKNLKKDGEYVMIKMCHNEYKLKVMDIENIYIVNDHDNKRKCYWLIDEIEIEKGLKNNTVIKLNDFLRKIKNC